MLLKDTNLHTGTKQQSEEKPLIQKQFYKAENEGCKCYTRSCKAESIKYRRRHKELQARKHKVQKETQRKIEWPR